MSKLKKIIPEELSYLAGFLDGDGCINAQIVRRSDYKLKFQIRVSITFFQKTNRHWFLIWLDKKLDCGTLRKRPDGMSEYAIIGIASVRNLLSILKPYLKLKKRQAILLLKIIEKMPHIQNDPQLFLKLCEQVDHFSEFNDSKKRKLTSQVVRSEIGETLNLFPVETET
uniref:Putative site-specific DNA endonuclease n=1 Tax=Tupiella akineta TaxID=160070 RepID=Q3ZIY9_TUPAK|nr:putative site-specific DNA endonuclease [Tupiella akineta]YP_636278.1 putative site-specific DNA endonuclease [Tupiella akineta]AAV80680.1 putative site-specific DNA endonuclease [Tupiella akineta]AAV80700.1 putative site-specific DNA endonuclease [Tupiella akineta]